MENERLKCSTWGAGSREPGAGSGERGSATDCGGTFVLGDGIIESDF